MWIRGKDRKSLGWSLPELMVSLSVFALALGMVFVLFQKCYQTFHFLQQRQSLQAQVLRVSGLLEADFRQSHLYSVGVQPRSATVDGLAVRQDAVSCLTLDNWSRKANFIENTGIPKWNQYVIYLVEPSRPKELQRWTYQPSPRPPRIWLPVAPLSDMFGISQDKLVGRRTLCESVLAWECEVDLSKEVVVQTLRLRSVVGRRGIDDKKAAESFEARFRWAPKNTLPKVS